MVKGKALRAVRFLRQRLEEDGISVSSIIVFGSHARGEVHRDSDLDVAIISEDFRGKDIFGRAAITKRAEIDATRKFLVPFDIVTLTPEELQSETSLIAQFVSEGVAV